MIAINLYELTRVDDKYFNAYEKYLSKRTNINKNKFHEIESLKSFIDKFTNLIEPYSILNDFYFSYTIPQISKEFDLLRIGTNYIINVELKSQITDERKVIKQLQQNRFYLHHLERDILSYVYNSSNGYLYQLSNDNIHKIDFNNLIQNIKNQTETYTLNLDKLFSVSMFLVSPLNNTKKFLNREYFLTLNQTQIKEEINKNLSNNIQFMALKGSAGCGKTLLIYDLSLYNIDKKVCIIHCGNLCDGHNTLNNETSLDIYPIKKYKEIDYTKYNIIIMDEAQRVKKKQFDYIIEQIKQYNKKIIFSYDENQVLNNSEVKNGIPNLIETLQNVQIHRLSKKIRTNPEILSFIKRLFNLADANTYHNYNNIQLKYAYTEQEAALILQKYINDGYVLINYTPSQYRHSNFNIYTNYTNHSTHSVIGQEFDKVIMYLDNHFYYEGTILKAKKHVYHEYLLRQMLFQGITRVRNELILVIIHNEQLFKSILEILK